MDSATVDGAHDAAAMAQHSRFSYLFLLVWFPRSGAAHTIGAPAIRAKRLSAIATQDAGLTIAFFHRARAPENV